jgi:hypothetical protein
VKRIKYLALLAAFVFASGAFIDRHSTETRGQTHPLTDADAGSVPDRSVIDRFDQAVQKRFITQPDFGIARIVEMRTPWPPQPLESRHVRSFSPVNDDERELVAKLEKEGWLTGIYLFGKRATPRENAKEPMSKFDIRYRVKRPVPVSAGLKESNLPGSKKIIREVKDAFMRFQSATDAPVDMRFQKGDWTFVAKPVRAVNESCVTCHADYVVTTKLDNGKFQFRKRQVGDVNGVIVYGFSKKDKKD